MSRISFTFGPGSQPPGAPKPGAPFPILILGDFSGRLNRSLSESLADREPRFVDVDNFTLLMEELAPELTLDLPGGPLSLSFSELESFHPDAIYDRAEIFAKLRQTRKRLLTPATFAAAAKEMASWMSDPSADPEPVKSAPAGAETFAQLLEQTFSAPRPKASKGVVGAEDLIRRAVAPHIVPSPDPRQDQLVEAVDNAVAAQMREILHHPDFQNLESAWRGLDFLTRHLETNENLKIALLDVTEAELATDLESSQELNETELGKILVERTVGTPGGEPWAIVMGHFTFGPAERDVNLLARLATLCQAAGAAFLSGASRLFRQEKRPGQPAPDLAIWQDFRRHIASANVGLVAPRFVLRLPYGKGGESIERFEFEELDLPAPNPDHYLWGNGAFAATYVLALSYQKRGWNFTPGEISAFDGLPVHSWKISKTESVMAPCVESLLTDKQIQMLIFNGLIPLVGVKNRDTAQIARFTSVSRPPKGLAGRWKALSFDTPKAPAEPAAAVAPAASEDSESSSSGGGDDDLDSLLSGLGDDDAPAKPAPSGGDDDLDSLLAGLGGDDDAKPAASGGDDDLDSLLAGLGGDDDTPAKPSGGDDDLDLDALLADL